MDMAKFDNARRQWLALQAVDEFKRRRGVRAGPALWSDADAADVVRHARAIAEQLGVADSDEVRCTLNV